MEKMTDGAVLHQTAVGPFGDLWKQLAGPNGEEFLRKIALVQANNALFFNEGEVALRKLVTAMVERMRTGTLTERQLRMWRRESERIIEAALALIAPPVDADHVQVERLGRVWAKAFGCQNGFGHLTVPPRPEGAELLIVKSSLSLLRPNAAWAGIGKLKIPRSTWWGGDDVESKLEEDWEAKMPPEPELAWVRDRQEADEEHKNVSANKAIERGLVSENLVERMQHEAIYFLELDPCQHLDVYNWTLCSSGPRVIDDSAPCLRWDGGALCLRCCPLECCHPSMRLREVFPSDPRSS